jgi:hypothetical protein
MSANEFKDNNQQEKMINQDDSLQSNINTNTNTNTSDDDVDDDVNLEINTSNNSKVSNTLEIKPKIVEAKETKGLKDAIPEANIINPDLLSTVADPKTAALTTTTSTVANPIAKPTTIPAVAESKNGYSFIGNNIFKVTQEAGKGTCVIPSTAEEVNKDKVFIDNMKKDILGIMPGGSRSANKKNKTCKKNKGGRKHKKSQKHKKAKKC